MAIIILDYEVEVNTTKLILWYIDIGRLEFLEMHCLFLSYASTLVVGLDCKLKLLANVFEEDLLLKNLTTLLKVSHITLLDHDYT